MPITNSLIFNTPHTNPLMFNHPPITNAHIMLNHLHETSIPIDPVLGAEISGSIHGNDNNPALEGAITTMHSREEVEQIQSMRLGMVQGIGRPEAVPTTSVNSMRVLNSGEIVQNTRESVGGVMRGVRESEQSATAETSSSRGGNINQHRQGTARRIGRKGRSGQPAAMNARIHLTDEDRTILIRLVVAHRMEYSLKKGAKAPFWNKMRMLLKQEIGKELKHPDSTVKQMADERRVIVQRERKESGTAQTDSEMDQNLDRWIEREDDLEKEKRNAKKPKEALEREAAHASVHRDNLLVSYSKKHSLSSNTSSDSDGTEDEIPAESQIDGYREDHIELETSEQSAITKIRRLRKKARYSRSDQAKDDAAREEKIVGALSSVGVMMSSALEKFASVGSSNENQTVNNDIFAREEARKALEAVQDLKNTMQAEISETKDMLKMILDRMGSGSSNTTS